jgi:hypothetical protein
LHRDRAGRYYVRTGRRGGCRQYIEQCEVTYFDGKPELFAFIYEKSEWEKVWEARNRSPGCRPPMALTAKSGDAGIRSAERAPRRLALQF